MKTYICISTVYFNDTLFVIGEEIQLDEASALSLALAITLVEAPAKSTKQLQDQ